MTAKQARAQWNGALRDEVVRIIRRGWQVVAEGKHYRAYCPCKHGTADFQIAGTPKDDDVWADRVRRDASKCPKNHAILLARKRGPGVPPPSA
ncbi:hypothetical protein [Ornithinimicrobium sp. INDO-MA30-4]|uniref:hypothetical protein n=1 Tax=Ornithinimicrobium sp. INDO-MA30-4 TaxID=2908651 RepID=UPI001F16E341|nr:hypothetical protein [Ornithinimicrobium sp. INDO-MA30-4]UJH69601.1 hypothetical protein L0A91_09545 [Ornithinimicrobium sp. INDO-MA30-4]